MSIDRQIEASTARQRSSFRPATSIVGIGILGHVLGDDVVDIAWRMSATVSAARVGVLHQVDALVEDRLALVVLDVVELQQFLRMSKLRARPSAAPSPAPC